jgi:hypothetical protein
VGEVTVHLEHELGAVGERTAEAGEVGRPEALFARPVEDVDEGKLRCEPVGDLAGAVGRAVVDDEHAVLRPKHRAERVHHRLEVLLLVVGGQADRCAHGSRVSLFEPTTEITTICPRRRTLPAERLTNKETA